MVFIFGFRFGIGRLTLPESTLGFLNNATKMAITMVLTWLVTLTYDVIHQNYLVRITSEKEANFGVQILPVFRTFMKILIWSLGVLIGLSNAGYDVGAALAGLGIGGLAFALAAQDTVTNIFGGITIFMQRPFKVEDQILFEGNEIIVKEIGLRATKFIDKNHGHTVYIPNSKFTGGTITNISDEPGFWLYKSVYLAKSCTSTQLESLIKIIADILNKHSDVDGAGCYYNGYRKTGHEISYYCHIISTDISKRVQTELGLTILNLLEKDKIELV